jgi:Tfp pilus assembly protein PilF
MLACRPPLHSRLSWTLLSVTLVLLAGCGREPAAPAATVQAPAPTTHVGQRVCAECHQKESALWMGSDHQRAMEPADRAVGDFKNASLLYNGIRSSFSTDGNRLMARTDGPGGQMRDYEIAYTFGITPLQQYLVAFPGGRYQALNVAWDSRPKAAGGQRWFHLYPGEKVDHRDVLHWTGPAQNWNFMCADCHSTNLQKRYDAASDRYDTTWSEINVSCEACHGPGSRHVEWARKPAGARTADAALKGLVFSMKDTSGGQWMLPAGASIAQRTAPLSSRLEVETCARCHARAARVWQTYEHGRPLADTHRAALLDEGLYEADGQIRDEVYEYGSFLQSKMYMAGVTCSDCHDPHSDALRLPGNALCAQCHLPTKYDQPSHHFHTAGTAGAQCASCHMPERRYMVVDDRRDHSFRIPRPDESMRLGTPNTCTSCHTKRSNAWAAAAVAKWHGPGAAARPSFAAAFHAGRTQQPEAASQLSSLVADRAQPPIVRATALTLLSRYAGAGTIGAIDSAAQDPDPLVRRVAADSLNAIGDVVARARIGGRLLADRVRAVRVDAMSALAGVPKTHFAAAEQQAFDAAVTEYRELQRGNADRAEALVNLGMFEAQLGRMQEADLALRTAIARQPQFVPGYVTLAEILRTGGREAEAERVLRDAIAAVPTAADAYNALGLSLVRQRRMPDALDALTRAAALAPNESRFAYVLAVAQHDTGATAQAVATLERAHRRHPGDLDMLRALISYALEARDIGRARRWAAKLAASAPDDPLIAQLRQQKIL